MKIKKILMYLLLPALLLTLFACGGEKPTPAPIPTPTPKPTPKPDENPKPSKVKYSVKFFDGQTLLADKTVEKNNTVDLPATPAKEGHEFKGWYLDKVFTQQFVPTQKVTSNLNVYAKFTSLKYNVDFFDGAKKIGIRVIEYNQTIQLPDAPKKDGYNFVGWFQDSELTKKLDLSTKVTKDMKIYAKYLTDLEYFLEARTNTVEKDTFKYNYSLSFTNVFENKIKNVPLPGAFFNGTTYYNRNNSISYLRDEITSGALLKDQHNYHFLKDGNLHKVAYKHNKKTNKDTDPKETIKENFKEPYEYSIYAKALFKYAKDKISSATKKGSVYELTFTESQIDLIKEFLISHGQEKVAGKLKQENIREIKVSVEIDTQTHTISKFRYSFEFAQDFEQKILGKTVKGTLVSKLNYELTFDKAFNGEIPLDNNVKHFVK